MDMLIKEKRYLVEGHLLKIVRQGKYLVLSYEVPNMKSDVGLKPIQKRNKNFLKIPKTGLKPTDRLIWAFHPDTTKGKVLKKRLKEYLESPIEKPIYVSRKLPVFELSKSESGVFEPSTIRFEGKNITPQLAISRKSWHTAISNSEVEGLRVGTYREFEALLVYLLQKIHEAGFSVMQSWNAVLYGPVKAGISRSLWNKDPDLALLLRVYNSDPLEKSFFLKNGAFVTHRSVFVFPTERGRKIARHLENKVPFLVTD